MSDLDPPLATSTLCPSPEALRAFLVGDLTRDALESVALHLEECATCSSSLADFPPDTDELVRTLAKSSSLPVEPGSPLTPGVGDDGERFQIREQRDQGGIGVIFVARDREVPRDVAIKEIRSAYAHDPRCREQFLREAEITGSLEHPGIAPIYSLGRHRDGRPYYAMRLIDGETLQSAISRLHAAPRPIDPRSLEMTRLIRRLIDACNALAYAHSRGILHGDITPRNIMLGPFGETLVIDWGLATRFEGAGNAAERSASGSVSGTASYMSPEQASGSIRSVGPTSDVYSLGATLFHLLAGTAPPAGSNGAILHNDASPRTIRNSDVPTPRSLNPRVPRPLDAICQKAMSRSPHDRYTSPAELARDLERWLSDEPVAVLPEGWIRRGARWLRRHRGVAGIGSAALLIIAVSAVAAIVLIDRARLNESRALARADRRMGLALEAIEQFRTAIATNPEIQERPDLRALRQQLLSSPLDFLSRLREDLQSSGDASPAACFQLAWANLELAMRSAETGSTLNAIEAFQEGIAELEVLIQQEPTVVRHRLVRARSLGELAMAQRSVGRRDEAEANLARSLSAHEELARGGDLDRLADTAVAVDRLARLRADLDPVLAEAHFSRSISILEGLCRRQPANVTWRAEEAAVLNHIGILLRRQKRWSDARKVYERSVATLEQLVRTNPGEIRFRRNLAAAQHNLGNLNLRPGGADPRPNFRRSCELLESLISERPAVIAYRADLVTSLGNLAVLNLSAYPEEARATFERMRGLQEEIVRESPEVQSYRHDLALTYINIAGMQSERGETASAVASFKRARELLAVLEHESAEKLDLRRVCGVCSMGLGGLLETVGRSEESLGVYEEFVAQANQAGTTEDPSSHPLRDLVASAQLGIARSNRALLRSEAAISALFVARRYSAGNPSGLYEVAAEYARCSTDAPPSRTPESGSGPSTEVVLDTLREAVKSGFKDVSRIEADPAFAGLSNTASFRRFLEDLFFPANPFLER